MIRWVLGFLAVSGGATWLWGRMGSNYNRKHGHE